MVVSGSWSRRRFVAGLGSLVVFARSARAADFSLIQYHNQTADSPLHRHRVAMWEDVRRQTRGREIQFFTLMGGALGSARLPSGSFENGMREMTCRTRPIMKPDDLNGLRMRVPPARIFGREEPRFTSAGSGPSRWR